MFVLAMFVFVACEEPSTTGTVKVSNSTGYSIVVDVNDGNGNWLGEKQLSNGYTATYSSVEEGVIDCSARFSDESYWYSATPQTLSAGGTVYFEWYNYKKSAEINVNGLTTDINIKTIGKPTKVSSKQ